MQLYTFAGEIDMEIAIASFGKACRNGVVRHCRVMEQSVWRKSVILLWQMQSRMILS